MKPTNETYRQYALTREMYLRKFWTTLPPQSIFITDGNQLHPNPWGSCGEDIIDYRMVYLGKDLTSFALIPKEWDSLNFTTSEFTSAAQGGHLARLLSERCENCEWRQDHSPRTLQVYFPSFLQAFNTYARGGWETSRQTNYETPDDEGRNEGHKARMAENEWPYLIIGIRYHASDARTNRLRKLRIDFFDSFYPYSYLPICGTSLATIDISPASMKHIPLETRQHPPIGANLVSTIETPITETRLHYTIETGQPSAISRCSHSYSGQYRDYKHFDVVIYETMEGKYERRPQKWGWLAFDQSVREDSATVMKRAAQGLWGEEFGKHQLVSVLGCGPYILVNAQSGFYIATWDFNKIGFLSKSWAQAIPKIVLVDNLENLLTETVDDDKLDEYYLALHKALNWKSSEDFSFTDTGFGSIGEGDVWTQEDEMILEGLFELGNYADEAESVVEGSSSLFSTIESASGSGD